MSKLPQVQSQGRFESIFSFRFVLQIGLKDCFVMMIGPLQGFSFTPFSDGLRESWEWLVWEIDAWICFCFLVWVSEIDAYSVLNFSHFLGRFRSNYDSCRK
jgi:hypothetical protein